MLNEQDLQLKLLMGTPVDVGNGLLLHIPKLKEIISLGESKYSQYLLACLFDKNHTDELKGSELSSLEILFGYCFHNEEFRQVTLDAWKFLFQSEASMGNDETNVFFYFEQLDKRIDKENFTYIQQIIRKANYIKADKEAEYRPANSRAAQMIERIKNGRKHRPKSRETMNLYSMISGLAWKSNTISLVTIFELTIYQLYNGFYTIENIDNYHHILSGIYAGTVDGKQIRFDQIHWAKILET